MTAETDLPPLPWIERYAVTGDITYPVSSDPDGDYVTHDDHTAAMQAYARSATEALRAKAAEHRDGRLAALERAEALRTEVQFLRSHRPIARRLSEVEARAATLREQLDWTVKQNDELLNEGRELTMRGTTMNLQRVQTWLSGALFVSCIFLMAEGRLLWALAHAVLSIMLVVSALRNEK